MSSPSQTDAAPMFKLSKANKAVKRIDAAGAAALDHHHHRKTTRKPSPLANPSKRKKRIRRDTVLLASLSSSIPIPKFDCELERLERDFFGENDENNNSTMATSHSLQTVAACREDKTTNKTCEHETIIQQSEYKSKSNDGAKQASSCDETSQEIMMSKQRPIDPALIVLRQTRAEDHGTESNKEHTRTANGDSRVGREKEAYTSPEQSVKPVNGPKPPASPAEQQQQQQRPCNIELLASIRSFLAHSDPTRATPKQCYQCLEQQFKVTFSRQEKSWMRTQLVQILQEPKISDDDEAVSIPSQENSDQQHSFTTDKTTKSTISSSDIPQDLQRDTEKGNDKAHQLRPDHSVVNKTAADERCSHSSIINHKMDPEEPNGSTKELPGTNHRARADPHPKVAPEIVFVGDVDSDSDDGILQVPRIFVPSAAPSAPQPSKKAPKKATDKKPAGRKPAAAAASRGQKRTREHRCQLCTNCPCTFAKDSTASPSSALHLANSDDAIERALIRQVQKLEKTAEQYEDQLDAVRRRLKKHRREMWQKMQGEDDSDDQQRSSRYLPDKAAIKELMKNARPSNRMSSSTVDKSKKKLFSFAANYQPTLTQMLGPINKKTSTKKADGTKNESLSTIAEEGEHEDDDEQLVSVSGDIHDDDEDSYAASEAPSGHSLSEKVAAQVGDDESWSVEEVSVPVHRVQVGTHSQVVASVWESNENGYKCQWDVLFDNTTENLDLDQLCDMFDSDAHSDTSEKRQKTQTSSIQPVDYSVLSQRGKRVMEDIVKSILQDSSKHEVLEASCPNWKENVCFALKHSQEDDINDAMESIQEAKLNLEQTRKAIFAAAERRAAALDVFEYALAQSAARLHTHCQSDVVPKETESNGFFSQGSVASLIYEDVSTCSPVMPPMDSMVDECLNETIP